MPRAPNAERDLPLGGEKEETACAGVNAMLFLEEDIPKRSNTISIFSGTYNVYISLRIILNWNYIILEEIADPIY